MMPKRRHRHFSGSEGKSELTEGKKKMKKKRKKKMKLMSLSAS